jgi:hypothetical protein
METTKTNGAFIESVKMAEKWFSDTNATMMEIYNKQLNLTTGFYNNMFNSLINNNKGWKDGQMTDSFLKNDVSKWFPISFSGNGNSTNLSNPLQSLFDTMYKQMTEYNQQNQKFWSEALKPNQMSVDQEDKKSKESNPIVSKKQSNSLVVS